MSCSLALYAVDLEALSQAVAVKRELDTVLLAQSAEVDDAQMVEAWYAVEQIELVQEGAIALPAWQGIRVAGNPQVKAGDGILKCLIRSRPPMGWPAAKRFPIVGHLTRREIAEHGDALEAKLATLDVASGHEQIIALVELIEAILGARNVDQDLISFFY